MEKITIMLLSVTFLVLVLLIWVIIRAKTYIPKVKVRSHFRRKPLKVLF